MRPAQLSHLLRQEFASVESGHHTPVMLWGPPGVGKSQIVAQIADSYQVPLIDIRLSQLEPSDLRGIPFRTDDGVEWAVPLMLPHEQRHGSRGILFLDEINAAPPTVSAAAYQLVLDRRLGEYQVPAGWAIFAAGNRQGDRGVSYTMPAPLANRFAHYEVEVNLDDWVAWAHEFNIDERLIGFLRFRSELLFQYDAAHNPLAFPTPRSWEYVHHSLHKFADNRNLMLDSAQACVGAAAAAELLAFLDHLHKLPDIDAIVAGEKVDMPEEIDLQYAVASSLVARALRIQGENNCSEMLGHIVDFAASFPQREMGIMLVFDLSRSLGEKVFSLPQFSRWAKDVAPILL